MILYSLDTVIRRWLLERDYSIHFYMDGLYHGSSALRELSKDTLQLVNTVKCEINSYNAFDMPDDFVDEVGVFLPAGQLLQPLVKQDTISPLRNRDSDGQFVPYLENDSENSVDYMGLPGTWFYNASDYGEPTGRYFGAGGGTSSGYKKIRERRQFQLTEDIANDFVILSYISDGQRADNATQIDSRAVRAIHSFIDWQRSPNAQFKDSGEARTYYNERRLLRSNLNEVTLDDIRNAIHKNTKASPKG